MIRLFFTSLLKTHPERVQIIDCSCSREGDSGFHRWLFWETQAVFERVKGVLKTTVGYSDGSASTASYDQVTTETTGHAESVEVLYDPSEITYGQLLRICCT